MSHDVLMSFNSGPMIPPPPGDSCQWISTDAYAEAVRITEAEVRADNAELGDEDMPRRDRVVMDESAGWPRVERGLHQP